jgi:hypothetical protein
MVRLKGASGGCAVTPAVVGAAVVAGVVLV